MRCTNMKASTAAANNTVAPTRYRGAPSIEPKTNRTAAGATDSAAAHTRKAAQSANHTPAQIAVAATSWKPGNAGAGATTTPNRDHAWRSALSATSMVWRVGTPSTVVPPKNSQTISTVPKTTAITATPG